MSLPCELRRKQALSIMRQIVGIWLLATVVHGSGCKHCARQKLWQHNGECKYDKTIQSAAITPCSSKTPFVAPADTSAAELALQAAALEAAHDPGCVDLYFAAACQSWQDVASLGELPARTDLLCESKTYHACLAKLLVTAQRFHRFDPCKGLQVFHANQPLTVPVHLHGFAWTTEDFNGFELVGDYELAKGARPTTMQGIGVAVVVLRRRCEREDFYRQLQPFAATAVLRTRCATELVASNAGPLMTNAPQIVLEFYNPAQCTSLAGENRRWTLAGDLTAPFALTKSVSPNSPVRTFLRPNAENADAQLVMIEPYQPGKIPIVFVHGLLSDPTTWITLGNSLRAEKWFRDRYQIWAYRYPSGMPFLVSAATLRRELNAAIATTPGACQDPAVQQMVLVGHSMGGLVSKLQVTESGTDLWDLVANRPLDQINVDIADRERLREVFFFKPLPFVKKVIFIGTPHRGSSYASRGIGRFASCVAKPTTEADQRHRRVVDCNPGVFAPWISRRVPTSVDMLQPDNPLLNAMERLPIAPCVQLHSIMGVAKNGCISGPGDGVVTLASATHPGTCSEKMINARHEELHEAATTLIEIQRILQEQLCCFDQQMGLPTYDATFIYSVAPR